MTTLSPRRDLVAPQQPPSDDIEQIETCALTQPSEADAAEIGAHDDMNTSHDAHVAHHFRDSRQQYEAAKLGMWLFLATEFLLFGGLFCLYAVFRHIHPEIFRYGSRFLDVNFGLVNTVVLILSSMTMAWAVRCAQLNQRKGLIACMLLTVAGGATFMGIKYVEYEHKISHNLVWGIGFYQDPAAPPKDNAAASQMMLAANVTPPAEKSGNAANGKTLWMATCRSCHDADGRGMPGQGKDIRGSEFINSKTDKELVDFIKVGRMPFDKLNTTGIQMPPRGGNPLLKDDQLLDIVSYIRTFKPEAAPAPGPAADADASTVATNGDSASGAAETDAASAAAAPTQEFYIPKSSIPNAAAGPQGLVANWEDPAPPADHSAPADPRRDPQRPRNAHLFFGIYFLMTGLHGLHVLAGMACISWLAFRAFRGHFTSAYFTPVDLVGLYWHVVDVIWIFLFPLLYLVH